MGMRSFAVNFALCAILGLLAGPPAAWAEEDAAGTPAPLPAPAPTDSPTLVPS